MTSPMWIAQEVNLESQQERFRLDIMEKKIKI